MSGEDLRQLLKRVKLNERQIEKMLEQALHALPLLQLKGIIHRDIKPENIFLGRDLNVKIGGFWIAKNANSTTTVTKTGAMTVAYASPERIDGTGFSFGADIWSLGAMLY